MNANLNDQQLNSMDREALVQHVKDLQSQLQEQTKKLDELDRKMQLLLEQIANSNRARFGRATEKMEDPNQICFKEEDGKIIFFNEAEAVSNLEEAEASDEPDVKPVRKKRTVGKKEQDLSGLKVNEIPCYFTDEELNAMFPNGWKRLPDTVIKRYRFEPAKVEVDEYHIGVYSDKCDEHMVKGKHPRMLLRGSLVSSSLAAAVINGKYVNAVPLYRLEQEFERQGLAISRQSMANWMIRLADEYLAPLYDRLHELLYDYHVIQADETPVLVNKDGRTAGAKSWMWTYRTGYLYPEKQIVLYDYQMTRNASHPLKFLKDFSGVCVTDGYQVYHTAEQHLESLKIAGCWAHARRKFESILKNLPKERQNSESVAYLVMKQIQAIYREEKNLKDVTSEERLKQRQMIIKPLVDALFVYLRGIPVAKIATDSLREAVTYILNQESYLRVFLEDGDVPVDNNAAERAIRPFCVGKKNWEMIDTIKGANSSAIIYSLVETAKANNLKPYDYFEYLLRVMPEHMDETDRSFLEDLLPWSPNLPQSIRKKP